jgi:small subunit ribosomal protein S4
MMVQKGDVIQVTEASKEVVKIQAAMQSVARRSVPSWLEADHANFKGVVKDSPVRDDVTLQVEENMIVEYYSR